MRDLVEKKKVAFRRKYINVTGRGAKEETKIAGIMQGKRCARGTLSLP